MGGSGGEWRSAGFVTGSVVRGPEEMREKSFAWMDGTAILSIMKSYTALEAKNRFGELIEAAQRQPVGITRNGRPSVVVISADSYARRQRMARQRLRQAMQRAGEHATAQGMDERTLEQLLVDEG